MSTFPLTRQPSMDLISDSLFPSPTKSSENTKSHKHQKSSTEAKQTIHIGFLFSSFGEIISVVDSVKRC